MTAGNASANAADGTDDGIVQVAPDTSGAPALNQRSAAIDPDGDIVHPGPLPPGTLGEGALIRVRLMDRLSTAMSQSGDEFRTRVVSDVLQDGQVLIPAGRRSTARLPRYRAVTLAATDRCACSPRP
jgi:hypothetical protein